jgi:hypothetical protein
MAQLITIKSIAGGLWYLVYCLGIALLVQEISPKSVSAYGVVLGAYGIGNFGAAMILGNMKRQRSLLIAFTGYIWLGLGFIGIGFFKSFELLLVASAVSGAGGLINDLPVVDLIQTKFQLHELPTIFRLRLVGEVAVSLVIMAFAPTLFKIVSVSAVIAVVGTVFLLFAVYGFAYLIPRAERTW